ncbi:MAG: gamma-glutamylcyclotransferase [Gammaproteobacteria bacterium]|nr:gamma-glutamylcyclotransferase [Gammaproteobacteria bacterium]
MLYFAYGSNLLSRRLTARIGACAVVGTAQAGGYRLVFHKRGTDGSAKADASRTRGENDTVLGVLYRLTRVQKQRLDEFEGPGYRTEEIIIRCSGERRQALTYVAAEEQIDAALVPFKWYRDLVMAGAYQWGFPTAYIEFLETHTTWHDPDRERHRRNMVVLKTRLPNSE